MQRMSGRSRREMKPIGFCEGSGSDFRQQTDQASRRKTAGKTDWQAAGSCSASVSAAAGKTETEEVDREGNEA